MNFRIKVTLFVLTYLFFNSCLAQEKEKSEEYYIIKGKVTHNCKPVPNVEIWLKGTTIGTVTDENGVYGLKSPYLIFLEGLPLLFSHISFKNREIKLDKLKRENVINIALEEKYKALKKVVIPCAKVKEKRKR